MLFTRTIRRTMVCGLAMVLLMMVGLSLSAVYSHFSHRRIFRELTFLFNDCPRISDLQAGLVDLKVPLRLRVDPKDVETLRLRQVCFQEALQEAKKKTEEFLQKMPGLRYVDMEQSRPSGIATDILTKLIDLELKSNGLADPAKAERLLRESRERIDLLQLEAREIKDFQGKIQAALKEAEAVFQQGFRLVVWSGAIAFLLFSGLIVYGYIWVFAPLRKLHQGARRVAQGDFNYRLEFPRQDEMKELADAFNSMTTRFQEIAGDLDRQVCERIKQLIRTERLAGIGFLAAGVAHEINNPLSAIAMAAESLADRRSEGAAHPEMEESQITGQYLQMIQREAFRCQRITRKLLDFARGNGDTCAHHDLTTILNDVLGVMRHVGRYNDRTIHFSRTTPCQLEINGPEIQQVVMNLISNGLEAMDSGGIMRISITEQIDHVTLNISDDGCGMTPEVIENLFEPFFTQRRNGQGTGLGLSISHRIVNDHGGSIEAESDGPGRGSNFKVRLPRRSPRQEMAA